MKKEQTMKTTKGAKPKRKLVEDKIEEIGKVSVVWTIEIKDWHKKPSLFRRFVNWVFGNKKGV